MKPIPLIAAALALLKLVMQSAAVEARVPEPNSADRILFWTSATDVAALTDADLDLWKSRGVGGFHGGVRNLVGMGGTQRFTGDPEADLMGKEFDLQRTLRDSHLVRRAKDRGLKLYLGFYAANYYNTGTPFKEWFDDAGWKDVVIAEVRNLAAAARLLGFAGITIDQELYPQRGGAKSATWSWDYPGNTHTEAEVRAKATDRGRQLMRAILEGFPQTEITAYHFQFPSTWEDVVQERVNKKKNAAAPMLFADFWDGMTSVEGYGAVRFIQALFYKTPHVGTWDSAFQYELNSFHAMASRRFSRWGYASSRIYLSPFAWLNGNVATEGRFTAPRPPDYVASQLAAFHKWGMGRELANFCYGGLKSFDYEPYLPALRLAATPSVVDVEPPRLTITSPAPGATHETEAHSIDLAGSANDNLAIRAVRWWNGKQSGAAQMNWQINSGDDRIGYKWQMNWTARGIPLLPGQNRIRIEAEDIKGLKSVETLLVTRLK